MRADSGFLLIGVGSYVTLGLGCTNPWPPPPSPMVDSWILWKSKKTLKKRFVETVFQNHVLRFTP